MLCLLIGCNISDLDFDNLKVDKLRSDLAVPFGTAAYTFQELLEDLDPNENYEVDETTGEIRFIYDRSISYTFSTDLFEIQDNSESTDLDINDASGPIAFTQSINFQQTYESQEGEVIDSVYHAASAGVRITVSSTSTNTIDYTLTLNDTRDVNTDVPLVFMGTISGGADQQNQGLGGYKTTLNEVAGFNEYDMTLDISANLGAGEDFTNNEISVQIEFLTQDFEILFGKLGRDTVDFTTETVDIDFFDNFGQDGIEFGGATMTFDVTSSFGVPIGLGLGGVYGEESDGTQTFLTGSVLNNPPLIASANLNTTTLQPEAVQSILEVNSRNSSLGRLLGTSPSTFGITVQGITNTQNTNASNFITQDAQIDADIQLEIPLEVSLRDVVYTLDFDISGGVDLTDIDSLELRMITLNELPFNATMDMFIMTSSEDTLYQVFDNRALDQPFLNFDRTVREPKIAVEDIPIGAAGTEALNGADLIRIVVTMNSPETQTSEEIYVKLLATARLEVTLGARGILDVDL